METFFPFHIPVLLGKLLFLALQEFNPAASKQMRFRKAALKQCMSLQSSLTDSPVTAIGLAGKTTAAHTAVHSVAPEAGKYQMMQSPAGTAPPKHQTIHKKWGKEGVKSLLFDAFITLAGVPKILQSKQCWTKAIKICHLRNYLSSH